MCVFLIAYSLSVPHSHTKPPALPLVDAEKQSTFPARKKSFVRILSIDSPDLLRFRMIPQNRGRSKLKHPTYQFPRELSVKEAKNKIITKEKNHRTKNLLIIMSRGINLTVIKLNKVNHAKLLNKTNKQH